LGRGALSSKPTAKGGDVALAVRAGRKTGAREVPGPARDDAGVKTTYSVVRISERLKYETRTTTDYGQDLDDYQALNHFIIRMETLVMDEVSDWRTQMQRKSASEPEI
jgi:hypothetical protein